MVWINAYSCVTNGQSKALAAVISAKGGYTKLSDKGGGYKCMPQFSDFHL